MARYDILPQRSEMSAEARSSVHPIHARAEVSGWVEASVSNGSVDVEEPTHARIEIATEALRADNTLINREIQKRLDPRRYPTVIAEIKQVRPDTGNRYSIQGELTLRHVTNPVTGWAELVSDDNGTLELTGGLTLDLRDFQLDPPKLLGMRVHPDVTVTIKLTASG